MLLLEVSDSRSNVQGCGLRVTGSGSRVQGLMVEA